MNEFKKRLSKKLLKSRFNNYGRENFDFARYGEKELPVEETKEIYKRFKEAIKLLINYRSERFLSAFSDFLEKYGDGLENLYLNLNSNDRTLLTELIAYRLLGFRKVKLSRNNKEYQNALYESEQLVAMEHIDPGFQHIRLSKLKLENIGYNINLFFTPQGVAVDFILEQYAYNIGGNKIIEVERGDTVLDLGGCWGDTALYFACKTGATGKVYSFEFIPENLEIFNFNLAQNPHLEETIELVKSPVAEYSGKVCYYNNNGPGSKISSEAFDGYSGKITTVSVDDFVEERKLNCIDFIKMDIEGGELPALKGAIKTISRFKPKLAIAVYHGVNDFVDIPEWILNLNLGYKLYLGHYTIHTEETVLFAKI